MFDKLPDGDRGLAPFVNRRVGGTRIELKGYETHAFEPPVVGNHFTVTPEDGFMRAPGRTEYDTNAPRAFLDQQINTGLRRIENMISRREEWMCAQALISGEIVISGEGVEDKISYWSELAEDKKPTSRVSTAWATDGVDGKAIIKDLSATSDSIIDRCGAMATKIICGKGAYRTLYEKFADSKLLDTRNADNGSISPTQYSNNIRRLGYLNEPGVEIFGYFDMYKDGNTNKPIIPDDVCLFVSPEIKTIMAYGAIANGWDKNAAPNIVSGTRFSYERPHDSLEQGRSIYLQSSPLPILQSTDGFHVLKVA